MRRTKQDQRLGTCLRYKGQDTKCFLQLKKVSRSKCEIHNKQIKIIKPPRENIFTFEEHYSKQNGKVTKLQICVKRVQSSAKTY